ncbi:MAG: hypothetical protein ACI3VK_02065 [Oscillospiraceae bacterium]
MKRIICMLLSLVILVTLPISVFAAQAPNGAELQYVTATSPIVNFSIDSSGNATIKLNCTGKSTVTKITAKTYIERSIGGNWVRVNVGTADNILTYTINSSALIKTYNKSMPGSGSYRCTTTFTLYACTTETIKIVKYASY